MPPCLHGAVRQGIAPSGQIPLAPFDKGGVTAKAVDNDELLECSFSVKRDDGSRFDSAHLDKEAKKEC